MWLFTSSNGMRVMPPGASIRAVTAISGLAKSASAIATLAVYFADAYRGAVARIDAAGGVGQVGDGFERQAQAVDLAPVRERRRRGIRALLLLDAGGQLRLRVEPQRQRITIARSRNDNLVTASIEFARCRL